MQRLTFSAHSSYFAGPKIHPGSFTGNINVFGLTPQNTRVTLMSSFMQKSSNFSSDSNSGLRKLNPASFTIIGSSLSFCGSYQLGSTIMRSLCNLSNLMRRKTTFSQSPGFMSGVTPMFCTRKCGSYSAESPSTALGKAFPTTVSTSCARTKEHPAEHKPTTTTTARHRLKEIYRIIKTNPFALFRITTTSEWSLLFFCLNCIVL